MTSLPKEMLADKPAEMLSNLQRLGIKLFLKNPEAVRVRDFVPVFHGWIQKQAVPEHLLVDVHDYSHIQNGPGILLVAHEGNFCLDMAEGRLGLMYYRKQPVPGGFEERLRKSLGFLVEGCSLLEAEPAFDKSLRFGYEECLVVANDRLIAPNEPAVVQALQEMLAGSLARVFGVPAGEAGLKCTARGTGKERPAFEVSVSQRYSIESLKRDRQ